MGVKYSAVLWNGQKKQYDKLLLLGIIVLITSFAGLQMILNPGITIEAMIIRTSSLVAVTLLHLILIIGPLCRINDAFLPLLYNRRHMGVTMFIFAAIHGIFSIIQFHSLGDIHPLVSVFLSNTKYLAISQFPFQVLGFFALMIFFLMAITSHDFWLKNLSPKIWKTLHMMVYVAYGMVILHVALGILQYENKAFYWVALTLGFIAIVTLHLCTGIKEVRRLNQEKYALTQEGFYEICSIDEIEADSAIGIFLNGQNIAIFKYDHKISAVNNICRHQMGPLSEGKVIDGCITCPWHGYQYLPHNGQSPPPFNEKLETYQTRIVNNKIWVNPEPRSEGSFVEPQTIHS